MIEERPNAQAAHQEILRCPTCLGALGRSQSMLRCSTCELEYPIRNGQADLRLQKPKSYDLQFEIDGSIDPLSTLEFGIEPNPFPAVDWSAWDEYPARFNETLASHVPAPTSSDARALDLGCGTAIHRPICEHAGYEWVGIDIDSEEASVLGDIQALPFEDDSFEFVLALGLLHLASNPFVMLEEVNRVSKPGATLIGTVGFLEPSGAYNHYHYAPRAVFHSLETAGFEIDGVDEMGWHGLEAITRLGLFPSVPEPILSVPVSLIEWAHRQWYRVGHLVTGHYRASEEYRRMSTTGSFSFVAHSQ